jgi:hypothetical protein
MIYGKCHHLSLCNCDPGEFRWPFLGACAGDDRRAGRDNASHRTKYHDAVSENCRGGISVAHRGRTCKMRSCPSGSRKNPPPVLPDESSSCCKNISISEYRKMWFTPPTSPQHEGRSANRHDTWGGMRWTQRCAGDAYPVRTAKSCGRGPPTLGSTPGSRARGDGG